MRLTRSAWVVAALATSALAACEDIPFAPKWDADWYLPLPTRAIRLTDHFPAGFILPGLSGSVSFPPEEQPVDAAVGEVLKQDLRRAILTLTVTKTTRISGTDTLYIAADSASLVNPAATQRIVFPLALTATTNRVEVADTLGEGSAGLDLLRTVGGNSPNSSLWIQLRGQVSNSTSNTIVLTASDSIGIRLAATLRIGVSTRGTP